MGEGRRIRRRLPLLELSGAGIRSGDELFFQGVRWALERGQQWALVGANGSGKTLFAAALAGQAPVVGGEVACRFRPRRGCSPGDAVALVSFEQQKRIAGDGPAAMRWFDAYGGEGEGATVRRFLGREGVCEINPYEVRDDPPRAVAAFDRLRKEVVRLVGVGHLEGLCLPALSNGEMRKVLIARALLRRPRLLILDDPFAGLDARFRPQLKRILAGLMRRPGFHLLLVAKRLDELPRGVTHLACVEGCRIAASGPLREMLRHPAVCAALRPDAPPDAGGFSFPAPARTPRRAASDELVRMEGVSVAYGGCTVFENLDWTVRRGEHWALVGPNGSGKSTLLGMVVGDHPQAYANRVYVFGRRRGGGESVWSLKKRIGWVSPELHLHFPEGQTCLDAVLTGFQDSYGCFRRPTAAERRAAQGWLEGFRLGRRAGERFGDLSAGLQRMVLLARALVKSPELLVLDEPCQGLDAAYRRLFLRAVEELMRLGRVTVVYVSHRADEVPRGVRRVLRLKGTSKKLAGKARRSVRVF
ncbi:MAG: ATP-binding cassette domain-containing protein [Acidobacteriota bacterium]|jgi:molybdate transport system ATP-binding protein|nr:ATP-binding cassette domain-containing protein [Acidobacteriota bacterium]